MQDIKDTVANPAVRQRSKKEDGGVRQVGLDYY